MKKFLKIFAMGVIALVTFCSLVACKNNAAEIIPVDLRKLGEYTELPSGTGGTAGDDKTYVTFGVWPQTIKSPDVTVYRSKSKKMGMFTYYLGSDSEWYCEAQENAYGTGSEYTYSDGTQVNKVSVNSYQYFKVEPIKWRVLATNFKGADSTAQEKKLLFAESGLMASVPYYDVYNVNREINGNTVYPNNYGHSKIRAWLNGLSYVYKCSSTSKAENKEEYDGKGFLQTAFSAEEQAKIAETVVDNSKESTNPESSPKQFNNGVNDYSCGNTTDKIFLLSMKEVSTSTYGFAKYSQFGEGNTRIRKLTDFALANYAMKNNDAAYGGWFFVRSPYHGRSNSAFIFIYDGGYSSTDVPDRSGVVVPALCVN